MNFAIRNIIIFTIISVFGKELILSNAAPCTTTAELNTLLLGS